jgi:hypothetical protein
MNGKIPVFRVLSAVARPTLTDLLVRALERCSIGYESERIHRTGLFNSNDGRLADHRSTLCLSDVIEVLYCNE